MESLPSCFKASCANEAACFVETEDFYVCDKHCEGKYADAIPLKSGGFVNTNINILKQAVNVFSGFVKEVRNEDLTEEAKLLCEGLTRDTEKAQSNFNKAKESGLHYEFCNIQTRVEELMEFMDEQPVFVKFLSRWFWDCMKKYISTEESTHLKKDAPKKHASKSIKTNKEPLDKDTGRYENVFNQEDMVKYVDYNVKRKWEELGDYKFDEHSQFDESKLEDRSLYTCESGTKYLGQWNIQENLKQGKGTQVWTDGSLYQGNWENNETNGLGRIIYTNGDVYEGEWLNGKLHGKGIYLKSDGSKYDGYFCQDAYNGYGVETWTDGSIYEGEYHDGKMEGQGMFIWENGGRYKGQFKNNNIHGHGKYEWSDGRTFDGQWENNKMHGYGTYVWKDGKKYEGQYINDKKEGNGTFFWPDGRKYIGQWHLGKQHGIGTYIALNGNERKGEWINGLRIKWLS
ncbi:unnamed protein product [Moneuplotes crassus]|uniref:MORN repeat protein n=1 Tax=Euplotes crassus TaxID=5936 RepID=A0AAD1X924_EUPCR|nr:unnamed protein product [Moneuplotes crassus]